MPGDRGVELPPPTFLVIGAMKAGTTSLWQYLRSHPDVFMADPKELHFFSRHFDKGMEWYLEHFAGGDGATAIGEASTTYAMHPRYTDVALRIAEALPDVRLVYVLRHPLERIRSHYQDDVVKGVEKLPIERAVVENPNYVDFSRYWRQIDRYLEHFPPDRLLLLASEDLRERRGPTLAEVFGFLGVDAGFRPPDFAREAHRTADKQVRRPWAAALRRLPGYRTIADRAPQALRRLNYRLTTRTGDTASGRGRDEIPAAVAGELLARLSPDLERLEEIAPDIVGSWELGGA